jgi:nucleotide-binding universal stress UspA family protein
MFEKILTAYDGSESARRAFDRALDLAKKYQAELHVLSVVRPPDIAEDVETEAIMENSQRHYEEVQTTLRAAAEAEGVTARFSVIVGHPAVQITTYAEKNGIDLIVMGHRGKTFFDRWLIGSVAKKVMSYAPCSVMIVR